VANAFLSTMFGRLQVGMAGFLFLALLPGCGHAPIAQPAGASHTALPPLTLDPQVELPPPKKVPESNPPPSATTPPIPLTNPDGLAGQCFTLFQATQTAFQRQPRLRVYLEGVEQAQRGEDIAFAPFLPMAAANYSAGAFDLKVGGNSTPIGTLPGFTFLPAIGSIPIGLNINTGYELADLRLQWLICDFGRRQGKYRQAGLAVEIAQLQCSRAYQTVANEVAVAYYQVLRTRALRKIAHDAVRRSEDDLKVAKKLARRGALEKEKVLRVEVQLAESHRLLDVAESAEIVAVAALNLAIGLNVAIPTEVQDRSDVPPFARTLAECLQTAIDRRREFQVARQSVHVADEGRRVAKASFAPRIVAEGVLFDFQQAAPRGHADVAQGAIKLEWGLFEGGKRKAELHIADSKIRAAVAESETIADTISFQVMEAYRAVVTARRGIERSQPAVAQARENDRLVRARSRVGDATSAEITDAESALTKAEQNHANSVYDYFIALARLDHAMGLSPTPQTLCDEGALRNENVDWPTYAAAPQTPLTHSP
jgi:outer membrane protein TolC